MSEACGIHIWTNMHMYVYKYSIYVDWLSEKWSHSMNRSHSILSSSIVQQLTFLNHHTAETSTTIYSLEFKTGSCCVAGTSMKFQLLVILLPHLEGTRHRKRIREYPGNSGVYAQAWLRRTHGPNDHCIIWP